MNESICYECKNYTTCKLGLRGYVLDDLHCEFFEEVFVD